MPIKPEEPPSMVIDKTELRDRLTPIEYQITQEKGTERPYSNKFYKHNEKGIYRCLICHEDLFESRTKYDSGSGWPSFYDVINPELLRHRQDASGIGGNLLLIVANPNLIRTEVSCKNCGSHLGHVFKDGPPPTGLRYCVNSTSLSFEADTTTIGDQVDHGQPMISHPATLGGCSSAGGSCLLKPKPTGSKPVSREVSPFSAAKLAFLKSGSEEKEAFSSRVSRESSPFVSEKSNEFQSVR